MRLNVGYFFPMSFEKDLFGQGHKERRLKIGLSNIM